MPIFIEFCYISCNKDKPTIIPLQKDWRIQSSAETDADAELISSPGLDADGWYKIDIPKTILAAMAEHDVYPDPYFGSNLKSIPGYREGRWLSMSGDSPFYPTWWYRKSFVVPAKLKGKRMVLHLDGINYKDPAIFFEDKLLIRKTGIGITASIDSSKSYTNQVVYHYVTKEKTPKTYSLRITDNALQNKTCRFGHNITSGLNRQILDSQHYYK